MRFITRRLASANLIAFALLCSSTSGAQSTTPPPLRADEAIVKTKDGCGLVVAANEARYSQSAYAAIVWGGACVEGLAMGEGLQPGAWAYWGRQFGQPSAIFHWDGKFVDTRELADDTARWPAEQKKWDDTPVVYRMFRDVDGNLIFSQKISCILAETAGNSGALRDCSQKKPYGIFRIETRQAGAQGSRFKSVLCPDPRSPKGCEALWQQLARPYFERSRAFVAESTVKAEALKREMPALLAQAQATALVAAQQRDAAAREKQAEAERLAAAAAAAVERAADLKAAEQRKFTQSLAQANPGQLFALADRLTTEGKTDQAREARRTLISRFPDHALAATAATQLAGGAAATDAASAGPRARFGSVCERNWEKILNGVEARGIRQSGYNDLWIRDFNWYAAKVFEPCIGTSKGAASQYESAMKAYNRINTHCAGPHEQWECLQWGNEGGISDNGGHPYNNPAYYAGWKADVDRALSQPDYSADLGSASGTGAANAAETTCGASLESIRDKFDAARKSIPEESVVVRSEAILWMTSESVATISAQCPNSATYGAQSRELAKTGLDIQRTCDAMSSRGACVARLPGREPVPAPPQAEPERKPLAQTPQASCDEGSGANWLQCKQEACSRMDGRLEKTAGSCVTCYAPGGNANWCPAGAGHNSAQ